MVENRATMHDNQREIINLIINLIERPVVGELIESHLELDR